jgi:hypothetical protein
MISNLVLNVLLFGLCLVKINKSDTYGQTNSSNNWITYIRGDSPIIIVASHDGTNEPAQTVMKTRIAGCWDSVNSQCIWQNPCPASTPSNSVKCPITTSRDTHTQTIAKKIQETATWTYNSHTFHPHYIANHLKRTKIDTNRNIDAGCALDSNCQYAWNYFHNSINTAIQHAITACDFAIVIDIHGHNQNNFTMMGYDINEKNFTDDANLNDETHSTIEGLGLRDEPSPPPSDTITISSIVRGVNSLGSIVNSHDEDWSVTPSQEWPNPNAVVGDDYFQGDYTVDQYGSGQGANNYKVDAIQIEIPNWIRTNTVERQLFWEDVSQSIVQWVQHWHSTRYRNCVVPSS